MIKSTHELIGYLRRTHLFIFIAVLFLALRLYDLGAESLWYDEVGSIDQATRDLPTLFCGFLQVPPLFPLILRYWSRVFGLSEVSLRFPSLIFSFFSFILAYKIAKLLFNKGVALITILLLALSPLHIFYSQEARYYMLSFFLVLLSVHVFLRLLNTGAKKYYYLWTLVNIACLYANSLSAVIILIENIIAIFMLKKNILNKKLWFFTQAAALVIFSLWIYFVLRNISLDPEFFKIRISQMQPGFSSNILRQAFEAFAFGGLRYGGSDSVVILKEQEHIFRFAIYWLEAFFLFLFGYSLFVLLKKQRTNNYLWFLILWLVLPIAIFFYFFKLSLARYFLICLLPFYILIAAGIYNSGSFRKTILVMLSCLLLLPLYLYYARVLKMDWKAASAYINKNVKDKEVVVVAPARLLQMLGYYSKYGISNKKAIRNKTSELLRETKQMVRGPVFIEEQGNSFIGADDSEQLDLLLKPNPEIFSKIKENSLWLIVARWVRRDEEPVILQYFEQFFRQKELVQFEGLEIYRFTHFSQQKR